MSKSAGNVITPDEIAATFGADALRVYLLFVAPFENNTVWEQAGIVGARRFLERTWRLVVQVAQAGEDALAVSAADEQTARSLHGAIRRVTEDIEEFKFNTAVAALMECLNDLTAHLQTSGVTQGLARAVRDYVLLIAPFAPHMAEELWERLGQPYSVHRQAWPEWDVAQIAQESFTLIVQIDGRVRERLQMPVGTTEQQARAQALKSKRVQRSVEGRPIAGSFFVPGKLINLVTEP
jgi:leucyl-tRNA synthetase